MTKYSFLTKEVLQQDYDELGTLSAIGRKYGIPTGSVKSRSRALGVKMNPSGRCKYTVNEDIFDVDSEVGFYIAGFMAADGNVTYDNRSNTSLLCLGIGRKDKDHLLKIRDAMDFTGPISDYSYFNKSYGKMTDSSWLKVYCSKKVVADIGKNFNVVPQKTFTYEFPEGIINHNMVRHFIRGYFDGDGSFYADHLDRGSDCVCFDLLGTEHFLEIVRNILERDCNLQSTAMVHKCKNIFRLRYAGNGLVAKIAAYLYDDSTIYLQRKFDKISHLVM